MAEEFYIKELAEILNWKQVAGDKESAKRPILIADVNRPGFELMGYTAYSQKKRLVVLGNKEIYYIKNEMDEISQRRNLEYITSDETPGILISSDHDAPEVLIDIANRKNFPVFITKNRTTTAIINTINVLEEKLAPSVVVHGELLLIHGIGVMITGGSGMGKSEIALELVQKGHQIIADDRIDCYKIHNQIFGRTAETLAGFMELRGVGVINVARMYGVGCYGKQAQISLQIELVPFTEENSYDRLGIEEKEYADILGVKILKLSIPVSIGRPMATIIEAAVYHYMLLSEGKDPAQEIEDKVLDEIEKNKEDIEENETVSDK